jgi:hypothetical protein
VTIATTPTTGGRLELSLSVQSPDGFAYEVDLFWPGGNARGLAKVTLPDGVVDLTVEGAPEWLVRATGLFLRGLYRDARDAQPLPRRVTRWREDPGAR